jgi:hypothetical protein
VTPVLAASAAALATAPAVLVTLLAVLMLLGLRAWTHGMGQTLTRQVVLLLDTAIVTLAGLFIILVAVRFVTVG